MGIGRGVALDIQGLLKKLEPFLDSQTLNIIKSLSSEEITVLGYFIQNISVGSIIALRELKAFYKVQDPKSIIKNLIDKGLLEQGHGCYNLSKALREALFASIIAKKE